MAYVFHLVNLNIFKVPDDFRQLFTTNIAHSHKSQSMVILLVHLDFFLVATHRTKQCDWFEGLKVCRWFGGDAGDWLVAWLVKGRSPGIFVAIVP